jgi:hypothetical protein
MPVDEKVAKLRALGYLAPHESVAFASSLYGNFLTNFVPTPQLWQRLRGDESWKPTARVHEVHPYPPYWERAVSAAVGTNAAAPSPPPAAPTAAATTTPPPSRAPAADTFAPARQ